MITWMQRHKKYLIITIWISTIAFIGAGAVGWGSLPNASGSDSVAKVGNIEISMGELQKRYSRLYNQYNQVFQGNFDEEKANSFGLKKQALSQLIDQTLLLNLAADYNLQITDEELFATIKKQEYFLQNGVFTKENYQEVLSRNNLTMKEYETDVRQELLIQKTLSLLQVAPTQNEREIFDTLFSIADTLEYKLLAAKDITVETSDALLQAYWEPKQQQFMTQVSYEVRYIQHKNATQTYSDAELEEFYNDNKTSFKDSEGKILEFTAAKDAITQALSAKNNKNNALKEFVAFKKGEVSDAKTIHTALISQNNNPFNDAVLEAIQKLAPSAPFMKPMMVGTSYISFELVKTNPAQIKTFQEAKKELLPLYVTETKKRTLLELAEKSHKTFKGNVSQSVTSQDAAKLTKLTTQQANEFLATLFTKQEKQGFVPLSDGDVVLYTILEQKLLKNSQDNDNLVVQLKSALFNEGLIQNLRNKYATQIFIEGL